MRITRRSATITFCAALSCVACERRADREEATRIAPPVQPEPADVERLITFAQPDSVVGELVYVPVYSSVFHHVGDREYFLTATLSIHNIHLEGPIRLTAVNYYNTRGQRIRELVAEPIVLGPLETKQFVIPQFDKTGGAGANFIVKWEAVTETPSPLIEALMISTLSQQGISFVTQGSVIRRLGRRE